jgi:c-di-GMP-binding flagellar brake protein YcgR
MKKPMSERRRFIRLEVPVELSYRLPQGDRVYRSTSKNISPEGLGFQVSGGAPSEADVLDITLELPSAPNPVHIRGKVVWKKRLSLEDNTPYDIGVEFLDIDEDNKNTFLRYLCDLIYSWPKMEDAE